MDFDYDTIDCDVQSFVALPTGKSRHSNEIDAWFTYSHPEHDEIAAAKDSVVCAKGNSKAIRTIVSISNKGHIHSGTERENILETKPDTQIKLNNYRMKKEELIIINNKGNKTNVNKRANSSISQSESKRVKTVSLEKTTEKNATIGNSNKHATYANGAAININKAKNVDDSKAKKKCQNDDIDDDLETKELIKQFNLKRLPKAKYEPPRHSVRLVRQWEKINGKLFANLNTEEREQVNIEISKMKENL